MKNTKRTTALTLSLIIMLLLSFNSSFSACLNPAFDEGADRTYIDGDILSRAGKDYQVLVAGWANSLATDAWYAPGTGSSWTSAWTLLNDPCIDGGGGDILPSEIWETSDTHVNLNSTIDSIDIDANMTIGGYTNIAGQLTIGTPGSFSAMSLFGGSTTHGDFFVYDKTSNPFNQKLLFKACKSAGVYASGEKKGTSSYAFRSIVDTDNGSTGTKHYALYSSMLGSGTVNDGFAGYFEGKTEVEGDFIVGRNGGKYLFFHGFSADSDLSLVPNSTSGEEDWNWAVDLRFSREGTLVKRIDSPTKKALTVELSGQDVFRVMGDGTVWATEVNVQLTPFPDYVFVSDYKLLELDELSAYISKNGHLPNIPSKQEVDENGIGLGELSRLQMEKIEELTLYTIQQQTSLTIQQQAIDKQQKVIDKLSERLLELENKATK